MKKLLALLLSLVMLMSCAGLTAFAQTTPKPVFELDLSGYTAENPAFSDKAGGVAITKASYSTNFSPVKTTFLSKTGSLGAYMHFIDDSGSGNWYDRGSAAVASVDTRILGQNELSFEFWVRASGDHSWDRIFQFRREDSREVDVEIGASSTSFRFDGKSNVITVAGTNQNLWTGDWRHIVMTRKWETVEGGSSKMTATLYIDGTQKAQQTFNYADGYLPSTGDEKNKNAEQTGYEYNLAIGGPANHVGSFLGDLASFKVYNQILTPAQVSANYEDEKDSLVAFDGKLLDGDTDISIHERELLIQLPYPMTEETAKNTVYMEDSDGDVPEGGIDLTMIGDSVARIRFGKLKAKEAYTIYDGDKYYTVTTGDEYLLEENFSKWTVGAVSFTADELNKTKAARDSLSGKLTLGHFEQNLDTGRYIIEETASGEKYLTIGIDADDGVKNAAANLVLDTPLEDGAIVVEMKFKASGGGSIFPIVKLWPPSGYFYKDGAASVEYKSATAFSAFRADSDGFYNLRTVITVAPVTDNGVEKVHITETFYDQLSEETVVNDRYYDKGSKLGLIELASVYNNGAQTDTVSVKDIKAYEVAKLEAVTNFEESDPEEQKLNLILSEEASQESLEKNVIYLVSGTGKKISTRLIQVNGRAVELQPSEHLDYNTEYTLHLAGLELASGAMVDSSRTMTFTTAAYPVEAKVTRAQDGTRTIALKNNSSEEKKVLAVLVGYNAGGIVTELVQTSPNPEITLAAGASDTAMLQLTNTAQDEKLFVWDVTDGMKPIKWEAAN